jgi:hypothetical protein
VVKYRPLLEAAFHHRKRLVWVSWRMAHGRNGRQSEGPVALSLPRRGETRPDD